MVDTPEQREARHASRDVQECLTWLRQAMSDALPYVEPEMMHMMATAVFDAMHTGPNSSEHLQRKIEQLENALINYRAAKLRLDRAVAVTGGVPIDAAPPCEAKEGRDAGT